MIKKGETMDLNLTFQSMTLEDVERFMLEGKPVILMSLANFYLKGPVLFKPVYAKHDRVPGVYSLDEIHNKVTFMTIQGDELVLNFWYAELSEQYEDILRKLVLLRS